MFPKEDSHIVTDATEKDIPADGKYEGFADVNDAIITELKTLLLTDVSTGKDCFYSKPLHYFQL